MPDQYAFRPNDLTVGKSLDAATTGTGQAIAFNDCRSINWVIQGNGAVGAGAVVIESSNDPNYAGVWMQVVAPVTVVANAQVGGKADFPPGGFVRARVTTTVTGGTVTVWLNGLKNI
ncbi:MAG TPA: hypothetical protein VFV58_34805 [Blastocatellia bacterium]|jgi:hypothetical protein|nr:hypothetical protein [Blastocatellia bacterium]